MPRPNDVAAVLSDPEAIGEAIKKTLSGDKKDFLDEELINFLRGFFEAKAALEMRNV